MQVVYQGIYDEVQVPDIGPERIKRGHPVQVSDELAERLLRQSENWAVSGARKASPSRPGADTTN